MVYFQVINIVPPYHKQAQFHFAIFLRIMGGALGTSPYFPHDNKNVMQQFLTYYSTRLIMSIREIERRLNSCHHSVMATVETMLVLVLLWEGATIYMYVRVLSNWAYIKT